MHGDEQATGFAEPLRHRVSGPKCFSVHRNGRLLIGDRAESAKEDHAAGRGGNRADGGLDSVHTTGHQPLDERGRDLATVRRHDD